MAGLSLTVTRLDEELEQLWLAPADAPAFRRGGTVDGDLGEERTEIYTPGEDPIPDATAESQGSAQRIAEILGELESLLGELERSEEHTSELQSRGHLVCRLLLE